MKIREVVKRFKPYKPGNAEGKIRMDKNESPFPLPGELKREIFSELEKLALNRYPQSSGESLRNKLADFHGLTKDNIVVGSGSDQLISYSVRLFAGKYAIITPPTFSMYRFYAELGGLKVKPVPLGKNFDLNHEEIKSNLPDTAAVFLCSPNNPTGNTLSRPKIIEILNTGVPVILDEAYGEFADESNVDLIKDYDNLLVLKTFSKAFGLAGARVGYVIGTSAIIKNLLRVKPPYNLNSFSLKIAELLLDNYDLISSRVNFLVDQREELYRKFEEYSYPSQANFLLMNLDAGNFLLEHGIAVRKFTGKLANKIRVTLGTKYENDRLTQLLESYIDRHL